MLALMLVLCTFSAEPTDSQQTAPSPTGTLESAAQPPTSAPGPSIEEQMARALFAAMDVSLPAEQRAAALEQLAKSNDPRVIAPLSYLMRDREPEVRLAAGRYLGAISSEAAQQALLNAVRSSGLTDDVREAAVHQLGAQGLPSAADRLEEIFHDKLLSASLTSSAQSELSARFPERLKQTAASRSVHSGQILAAASGAIYGGYSLYGVGRMGKNPATGGAVGLLGGAVLGAAAGYLLGDQLTLSRSMTLMAATGIGLWTGVGVGYGLLDLGKDNRNIHLLAIGGEVVGLVASQLLWSSIEPLVEVEPALRRGGEYRLAIGAALLGGVALHLVSKLAPEDNIQFWGAMSGLVIGGAAGNLLGKRLTPPQAGFYTTGAAWGLLLGGMGGRALLKLEPTPPSRDVEGLVLLGGALGMTLAGLTWNEKLGDGDLVIINLMGAMGVALGAGSVKIPEPKHDTRPALALVAGSGAAGLVAGTLLAPHLRFGSGDRALIALGSAQGFFAGLAIPGLFEKEPPGRHHLAGMLLGSSLGMLSAGALSQTIEPSPAHVAILALGDGFGSVAGVGAGLLAGSGKGGSDAPNIGYLLGSSASLAVGSLVVKDLTFSHGDRTLVGMSTIWGAWNGLGLSAGLNGKGDQVGGSLLLGLGLGGIAGMALAQGIDVSPAWVLAAVGGGGAWGAYLSTMAVLLKEDPTKRDVLTVLAASDGGLALASVLLSLGVAPRQVGIASLGGMAGAVAGTLGAALATRDRGTLLGANLIGTGAGLAGGAIIAAIAGPGDPKEGPESKTSGGPNRGLGSFVFRGLTSLPVQGRSGNFDGMALAAVIETP